MISTVELEEALLNSLRASEERYRNLVENSSDWIWEVDHNAVYTYCSPQCFEMLGYLPEEIIGKTPFDLMSEEEAERIGKEFLDIVKEQRSFNHLENINIHKDGHQVIMETGGIPFFDDQNTLLGFRGIDRDITVRKKAEASVRRQSQIIDQIHDSVIATDMQGIVNSWNKGAERLFGINQDEALGQHISFVYPESEHAFLQQQVIAPLVAKGFHDTRVRMLKKRGDIFHAQLSLSLLYDENQEPEGMIGYSMDISSQVAAEQALKQSEKNLEITLNSIGDAVIVTDAEQRIIRMNPIAEQLTGWSLSDAQGLFVGKVFDICNTKTGEAIVNPVSQVVADKKIIKLANGSSLITRTGLRHQIADSAAPIMDEDNHFIGVVLVFHDVTKQYQVQEALYRSHLQFSAFVSAMPDIVFVLDEQGTYLKVYGTERHLLYGEINELLNKKITDILPATVAKKMLVTIQQTLQSNEIQTLEYELELPQGQRYFEGRVAPMPEELDEAKGNGRQVIWMARDITDKKQSLRSLQESEQRFRNVFEKMPNIAVQGYNRYREVIYWNETSEKLYGYSKQEALGEKLEQLIIPEDLKEYVVAATDEFLYKDSHIPSSELLLQRKDGSSIPVFSSHVKLGASPEQAEMFCIDIDLTDSKKASEEIEQLAYYDSLTNLPNRRLLIDRLGQEQKGSKRNLAFSAILFLDLDNFKNLNDSLGHSVGDLLLIEVGKRMEGVVREEDTVARLGGDEFVVFLKDLAPDQVDAAKQTQHIAEKLMFEFTLPINIRLHEYVITTSIGITLFRGTGDSVDTLLKQADTAMYRAKELGRNRYQFFHPSMQVEADQRLALEKDLRQALNRQELELYYQPQFDNENNITGAEALIRWNHPTLGMVSPAEFIPVAEETGLIIAIGDWIISTACKQLRLWEKRGLTPEFHLAVNVSPKQFKMQAFVPYVHDQIKQSGINPEFLTLELTEGIVIDNIQQTIEKMQALKSIGVKFSIDDFGTGYSSLVYLKKLPLDQLKIDQAFIRDIHTGFNDAVIVEAIISMAKLLSFQVIAEGVETIDQLAFLESRECLNYQGYYFCKPIAEAEFTALLKVAKKKRSALSHHPEVPFESGKI